MPAMQRTSAALQLPPDAGRARAELQGLLRGRRWEHKLDEVLIAVHEALTNADRHGGGIREAIATLDQDELVVEVADAAGHYDPSGYLAGEPDVLAERGRGLWLIGQIASDVEFRAEPQGTRVLLRFSAGTPPVTPRPPTTKHELPAAAEIGGKLLAALGAGVAVVDEELIIRDAAGPFAALFGVPVESLIGRDVRGVVAEMKPALADPGGFEDRVLAAYAVHEEPTEHLFVLRNGRLIRRHSVALRSDSDQLIGWLVSYLPVTGETQLVATMQRSLLPDPPAWPELEVGAIYHPAESGAFVGGDFYDFIDLPAGARCILVGDVSGRGTSAAAASIHVRAYLRAALSTHGVTAAVQDLEATLVREFGPEEFVTLAMCVQESQTMWTLTNCGHAPALLLRDGAVSNVGGQGSLLGMGVGTQWPRQPFVLRPDDVLLLYTDGVVDAGRPNARFGDERLRESLRALGGLSMTALVAMIDDRVHDFAANSIGDDHVLVAVRQR